MKQLWMILLVIAAGCGTDNKEQAKDVAADVSGDIVVLTEEQAKNTQIETVSITKRSLGSVLRANGKIEVPPQNMVSVSFPLGGFLKSTKLLPGAHVGKGEVIAVMEDQQFIQLQQDYLTAKARQAYLEHEYRRQQELNRSKASSDKVYQQAEAEYKSNNIMISALQQKLKLVNVNTDQLNDGNISRTVNVHAPVSGFVSAVYVNVGKYITPSEVMFDIVDPTDIHLLLTVFEKDISKLFTGQKVVAYSNNEPGRKFSAKIELIGKDIGADRAVQVHCHFDNYDKSLVPGMYMNAEIEMQQAESQVVPDDAIVRYGDKEYIFMDNGDKQYKMIEVITGSTEEGYTAVTTVSGQDITKPIVSKNAYTLLMMLKNTAE